MLTSMNFTTSPLVITRLHFNSVLEDQEDVESKAPWHAICIKNVASQKIVVEHYSSPPRDLTAKIDRTRPRKFHFQRDYSSRILLQS